MRLVLICLYLVSMANIVSYAHDQNIASLIQQLEHTDADVRDSAGKSLIEIGETAVPALIVGLNHEKVIVRRAVVDILYNIRARVPHNKDIDRALAKALQDIEVRYQIIQCFTPTDSELPPEFISGLVQLLYYGSPFFGNADPCMVLLMWTGNQGRVALIEAFHSSEWPLRFGAAITYGHLFGFFTGFNNPDAAPLPKEAISPKEVISIIAGGLTHPDWKTRDEAMRVLSIISKSDPARFGETAKAFDEARQALKALPAFAIISQTITDGCYLDDTNFDAFDSLNTEGITFKFNRSIHGSGTLTIKTVDGEPLGWNVEKGSHSVTITPPEGKELVKGQRYTIQLRDVKDILGNQVDAEIEFSTEVLIRSSRHAH
ncbi:MAG: HEAT repeat domain-containing protein [Candidatus Poribacteria bacterium]|nr:HEAT repeat domain-containing protein [Candidatus Poribacteria bacterium]